MMNVRSGNNYCLTSFLLVLLLLAFNLPVVSQESLNASDKQKYNQEIFSTLTFEELIIISKSEEMSLELVEQINYVLNNVAVDNTISKDHSIRNNNAILGDFIRVASWNIERGMDLDTIIKIFNNPDELAKRIEHENPKMANRVKTQINVLKQADILTLTEVDVGMPRTNYRNIVEEFAHSIGYNYAYGIEFLEVDPSHLGLEEYKWSENADLFPEGVVIDEENYRGLHGSAILSRFPLKNVRLIRLPDVYDWYEKERIKIGKLETLRRKVSSKFFGEKVLREIRYGDRIAIIADIEIPGLETPITVVSAHLENRTSPKNRRKQIKFLLNEIKSIKNPVIVGGDMNTAVHNAAPLDTKKTHKSLLNRFVSKLKVYNIPYKLAIVPLMSLPNAARKGYDPSIKSIPIFSVNPERGLFNLVRNFEFDDNCHFDFRSTPGKFMGHSGSLANSNERRHKGFVATYQFEKPHFIGKFKLDWLFVKAYCEKPDDKNCTYKMAPHFGMTLFDLNNQFHHRIADHAPITVDLPLEDPGLLTKPEVKEMKKEIKVQKKKKDPDAVKQLKEEQKAEKQNNKLKKQEEEK